MPMLTRFGGSRAFGLFSVAPILPGGYITSRDPSTIHKMVYSTEVVSALSWSRTTGGNMGSALGNAGVAGYLLNNLDSEKVLFPSDTKAASAPTLSSSRDSSAGASNSGSFGYAMSGYSGSAGAGTTTVDKITYSNDTRSTLGTGLSVAKYGAAGLGNRAVAAYVSAGYGNGTSTEKFNFSNDSRSSVGFSLAVSRGYATGISNSGTAGYIGGGFVDINTYGSDVIEKIVFSNDTRSTLSARMPTIGRWAISGIHNQGVAGYFAGGLSSASYSGYNNIYKIDYSNDNLSTNSSTMTTNVEFGMGLSDSI